MCDQNGINYPLQVTEVEKELGIWMDNKHKFFEHVRSVSKANQILGLIRRLSLIWIYLY